MMIDLTILHHFEYFGLNFAIKMFDLWFGTIAHTDASFLDLIMCENFIYLMTLFYFESMVIDEWTLT